VVYKSAAVHNNTSTWYRNLVNSRGDEVVNASACWVV